MFYLEGSFWKTSYASGERFLISVVKTCRLSLVKTSVVLILLRVCTESRGGFHFPVFGFKISLLDPRELSHKVSSWSL
jgi:hypothetical protein